MAATEPEVPDCPACEAPPAAGCYEHALAHPGWRLLRLRQKVRLVHAIAAQQPTATAPATYQWVVQCPACQATNTGPGTTAPTALQCGCGQHIAIAGGG